MRGKLLATAISAMLAVSVVASGCGGGSKASDEIKIGVVGEMTGSNATYGTSMVNGMKLAVKEINDKGGVNGKKINLVVADDKSEPAEAANAMSKLINQDKTPVVMGIFTSSNAIAAANVSEAAKVPFLAIGATNPKVTLDEKTGKVKPNTFRVCFIDPFQGTVGANFVLNELKLKKAVVFVDNSSDYSKGLASFFKQAYTSKGGEIVGEEAYLQKDTDFKATLTKIKASNPDMIYVPGYYQEVGMIVKQAREMGLNVPMAGGDGWDSAKLPEIAGKAALNNTYFSSLYSPDDDSKLNKDFVAAYQKAYNEKPDVFAALAYDSALLVINAIKSANALDTVKIKDAMAKTAGFSGVSGNVTFNEQHNPVKSAVIIEYKDGAQVFKTKINP